MEQVIRLVGRNLDESIDIKHFQKPENKCIYIYLLLLLSASAQYKTNQRFDFIHCQPSLRMRAKSFRKQQCLYQLWPPGASHPKVTSKFSNIRMFPMILPGGIAIARERWRARSAQRSTAQQGTGPSIRSLMRLGPHGSAWECPWIDWIPRRWDRLDIDDPMAGYDWIVSITSYHQQLLLPSQCYYCCYRCAWYDSIPLLVLGPLGDVPVQPKVIASEARSTNRRDWAAVWAWPWHGKVVVVDKFGSAGSWLFHDPSTKEANMGYGVALNRMVSMTKSLWSKLTWVSMSESLFEIERCSFQIPWERFNPTRESNKQNICLQKHILVPQRRKHVSKKHIILW